jgi:excisionase family DNA binding protein
MNQSDRLLNVAQTSEILGVHMMQIYKYAKTGELKPVRISKRSIRFKQSDINAFIEQRQTPNANR